jgi:hypothetical protein
VNDRRWLLKLIALGDHALDIGVVILLLDTVLLLTGRACADSSAAKSACCCANRRTMPTAKCSAEPGAKSSTANPFKKTRRIGAIRLAANLIVGIALTVSLFLRKHIERFALLRKNANRGSHGRAGACGKQKRGAGDRCKFEGFLHEQFPFLDRSDFIIVAAGR